MRAYIIALASFLPSVTVAQTVTETDFQQPALATASPSDPADDPNSYGEGATFGIPSFDQGSDGDEDLPAPVSKLYADLQNEATQPGYSGVVSWLATQTALPQRRLANQLASYQYAAIQLASSSGAAAPPPPPFITAMPQSLQGPASSLFVGEAQIVRSDLPAVASVEGVDFNGTDSTNGTDSSGQSGMMTKMASNTASTTSGQGMASTTGGSSTATGSSTQSGGSSSASKAGAGKVDVPRWLMEMSMGRFGGACAVGTLGLMGLTLIL